jgi:hypothetical protein
MKMGLKRYSEGSFLAVNGRESTRHGLNAGLKHDTVAESRLERRPQPGLAAPREINELNSVFRTTCHG